MGKPALGGDGARSDCGESAQGKADHAECAEERSDRRRAAGAVGASGPEAFVADSTPRPRSASGPGGDPSARGVGGQPDGADQLRAWFGEADGRTVEEVRCRSSEGKPG